MNHTAAKEYRRARCVHRLLPIRVAVRQVDGSIMTHFVDADVRVRKPRRARRARYNNDHCAD